jgi:hypothetical protein
MMGTGEANARDETRTESWFLPPVEYRFEPAAILLNQAAVGALVPTA